MALRLRRGTDAERSLITPLEGELIYTTDTKKLYVGDGITVGGIAVDTTNEGGGGLADLSNSSINDLGDVNADSTIPLDGEVLTYDSTTGDWRSTLLTFSSLTDVDISLASDGDILTYDIETDTWIATNIGAAISSGTLENDLQGSIIADDSTVIVDSVTKEFTGELNGSVSDATGNTLIVDGDNVIVVADLKSNVVALDDSIIVDYVAKTVTADLIGNVTGNIIGNVIGNITGDIRGSFFGDDSTLLIDGIAGKIVGPMEGELTSLNSTISLLDVGRVVNTTSPILKMPAEVSLTNDTDRSVLFLSREDSGVLADTEQTGAILFEKTDTGGNVIHSVIFSRGNGLHLAHSSTGNTTTADKFLVLTDGKVGIGKVPPVYELDVEGNIKAAKSIIPGVYADATARDTDIASPTEGMMVFLQDTQKMQVYVSDTGLAGGGVSNSTAAWYDMY